MADNKPKKISIDNRPFDDSISFNQCIEDLQNLQKAYPEKYITGQFYLNNGKYSEKTWKHHFGTFLEFRRQAGLQSSRKLHTLERNLAKHVSEDVYRNFYKEEVLPYIGKYEKKSTPGVKTLIVVSDIHDKEQDEFCMSVFYDSVKRIKPDVIVFNGDVFDLYEFSKFDKDPRQFQIKERFDCVQEIFKTVRKLAPNAQIDLIMGNHEYRLLRWLANKAPEIKIWLSDILDLTFSDLLGLSKYEINLVSKADLHAWTESSKNKELRKNYKIYYGCFICNHKGDEGFAMSGTSGHTHRPAVKTSATANGQTFWVTTGSMCKVETEYMETLEKAQNSFLIAHIDPKTKEVIPEHIMFSKNMAIVGGKIYKRKQ